MENNNNYNEPIKEGNPYGEPVQNPYVNKPADDYSYGEATEQPQVEVVQEPTQQTYQYREPEPTYYEPQKPEKTGLAVAALVLGIISVVLSCMGFNIIIAIIAIILGAVYLSKKQAARRGMAIAGLVLGIVSIVLLVLMVVLVVVFMFTGMGGMYGDLYNEMYNEILNEMY